MYLSELFLEKLDKDYTKKSVLNAVISCNQEFMEKVNLIGNEGKISFKDMILNRNEQAELLDFIDVFREFQDVLSNEETDELIIFRIVKELINNG